MADAIVTDIAPYRASKAFASYSDARIETRYELLRTVRDQAGGEIDPYDPLIKQVFPKGFDPDTHPEDNIDMVYAEGVKRGVFVP